MVLVDEDSNKLLTEEKFPTNTDIYFAAPEDDDSIRTTTLHTSCFKCSKPIRAPFAIHVGTCNDGDDFYLDLNTFSIAESDSILEFVDGINLPVF